MVEKSQVTWTEDEIATLHQFGRACLPYEIQKYIPRHTLEAISRKRKRLGIELSAHYISRAGEYGRSFLDNNALCKGNQNLTLPEIDKQILLGSILGDGCIKKNGGNKNQRNYIFYEGHRIKQTDYVKWKCDKLKCFNTNFINAVDNNRPEMWTTSYPMFTDLRKKIYGSAFVSTKTYIPLDVFVQLDLFGLLIWYLDDGHNPRSVANIACKGWNDFDLEAIVNHLNNKFSLSLYVYKSKHKGGVNKIIKFRAIDKRHVFHIWHELFELHKLPECMRYKLDLNISKNKKK
jgi:hypothetical protein